MHARGGAGGTGGARAEEVFSADELMETFVEGEASGPIQSRMNVAIGVLNRCLVGTYVGIHL